jgi:peptide/nickel transport system substrate-binding protein
MSPVPDHTRVSRRRLLSLLGSGAGLTLLTACAPISPPAPTAAPAKPAAAPAAPAAAPAAPAAAAPAASAVAVASAAPAGAAQPAEKPRPGGTLRAGRTTDVARLDGHSTTAIDTVWHLFETLTSYDENFKPQPLLAESWEVSADAKQIKLNLRKGVQFHTGRELTSEDIKWNMLRVRDPKAGAGALVAMSNWFPTIETPDKYTVILKSEQPRPLAFDFFDNFNIVDPVTMEGPEAQSKGVGTGPFAFAEWRQGEFMRFTKNKNYWQSGKPYLDEVITRSFRDAQSMVLQLEAGAIDVIVDPPNQDFARLAADAKYRVLSQSNGYFAVGANITNAPMDNKKLRQALNYAIDRKRFTEKVLLGAAEPQALPINPKSPAYEVAKDKAYAFDLDKAKALLAESGVSNLELDIVGSSQTSEHGEFAQIYAADLAKIGVKLNIKIVEQPQWLDQVQNRKYRGLYVGNMAYGNLEPATLIASSRHLDATGNSNTGFTNERYLSLVNSAAAEPDLTKRKALYSQLNDLLLDESFVMTLAQNVKTLGIRANVRDIGKTQHGVFPYTNAWLAS